MAGPCSEILNCSMHTICSLLRAFAMDKSSDTVHEQHTLLLKERQNTYLAAGKQYKYFLPKKRLKLPKKKKNPTLFQTINAGVDMILTPFNAEKYNKISLMALTMNK